MIFNWSFYFCKSEWPHCITLINFQHSVLHCKSCRLPGRTQSIHQEDSNEKERFCFQEFVSWEFVWHPVNKIENNMRGGLDLNLPFILDHFCSNEMQIGLRASKFVKIKLKTPVNNYYE